MTCGINKNRRRISTVLKSNTKNSEKWSQNDKEKKAYTALMFCRLDDMKRKKIVAAGQRTSFYRWYNKMRF